MSRYIPKEGELVAASFDGDIWYPILYVSVGDEQTAKGLSEYLINKKRYRYVV